MQQEALDFVAQGTANGAHRGRAPAPPRKVLQHPLGLRRHRREVSVAVVARSQSVDQTVGEFLTKFVPGREANHTHAEQERTESFGFVVKKREWRGFVLGQINAQSCNRGRDQNFLYL